MKEFFKVKTIDQVLAYRTQFAPLETEKVSLENSMGRILAEDIHSDIDLPDFTRSIMDGFAVRGASTFGASEGNPAYLAVKGSVAMGAIPNLSVGPGVNTPKRLTRPPSRSTAVSLPDKTWWRWVKTLKKVRPY